MPRIKIDVGPRREEFEDLLEGCGHRIVEGNLNCTRQLFVGKFRVELLERYWLPVDHAPFTARQIVRRVRSEADELRPGTVMERSFDGAGVEAIIVGVENDAAIHLDTGVEAANHPGDPRTLLKYIHINERAHPGVAGDRGDLDRVSASWARAQVRPRVDVNIGSAAEQLIGKTHRTIVKALRQSGFNFGHRLSSDGNIVWNELDTVADYTSNLLL